VVNPGFRGCGWRGGCYIPSRPVRADSFTFMVVLKYILIVFEVVLLFNLLIFVHDTEHDFARLGLVED
jgi:hypothetical protein